MESYWYLTCHDELDPVLVNECQYKPTGHLWADLQGLCMALNARIHPSFRDSNQDPAVMPNQYSAISYKFDKFSYQILIKILQSSQSVNHVRFNNCDLDQVQLSMLSHILTGDHIQFLQLDWNPGLPPDLYAGLMRDDSKLQTLSLRGCGIDDIGLSVISTTLRSNKHLKNLDLYNNAFTNIQPIAEALDENRTLEFLSLAGNRLVDSNIQCLCGVIGRHPFPEEQVEEHKKREADRDKIITKNAKLKGKSPEPVPIVDPIEQDPESGQWFILKNTMFKFLNLSLNKIEEIDNLKDLLGLVSEEFRILLVGNPLTDISRSDLHHNYRDKVTIQ